MKPNNQSTRNSQSVSNAASQTEKREKSRVKTTMTQKKLGLLIYIVCIKCVQPVT